MANVSQATLPQRNGWWKFDNASDLTKAEVGYGLPLTLVGTHSAANGPESGNGAVLIGSGSFYKMNHNIYPNGGGAKVNEYSLQYDFKIPDFSNWHCFFQTNVANTDDGDLFINKSGNIGVAAVGYSTYPIVAGEWYRLVVSVKNGSFFTIYLDGKLMQSGNVQNIDGRFALESTLLIFADEDGEDGNIFCAELAIWDKALTAAEVTELGGYKHADPSLMTQIPYLQSPGKTSMTVCWHDIEETGTQVKYGTDSSKLNFRTAGTSEIISPPFRWHTVKLTGLLANTRYFYRVASGADSSGVFSFKTLPDSTFKGKIRFVLLSDTHASDTAMAGKVLRAARSKISGLYGPDIENHVNGIFHSGDIVVSGNSPEQYTKQYFKPLAALSSNIPTAVVAGNHEAESPYFYNYLKIDELSAYPQIPALNEKIWNLRVGNSLFIGLNSNIYSQYGTTQADWLDSKLNETEKDTTIDFVFLFFHHPPFSELWKYVNSFDAGSDYVKNILLPVMKKYTKVQEIHYGHTHGFERGIIPSDQPDADIRTICGGGGGGPLDPWAAGENQDLSDIHSTISNYCFQILEIDVGDHSYRNSMYSLGELNKPKNAELLDTWYKKKNQPGPDTPVAEGVSYTGNYIQLNTSGFAGADTIMSAHLQVIDSSANPHIVVDTLLNWENIYGIDQNNNPVDLNHGINLFQTKISSAFLQGNRPYSFRVRYRDQNLKWSQWSASTLFNTTGINSNKSQLYDQFLSQNYPNPFLDHTTIVYTIPEKTGVIFRIYDSNNRLVEEINEGVKSKGTYRLTYKAENKCSDSYIYKMVTNKFSVEKKMIKVK